MEYPYMTIPEFCKVMRIHRCTFRRWEQRGVIPPEAVSRAPGRHPIVNYALANPEGYAVLKEMMSK